MRQADLARPRSTRSATDQTGVRNSVVRRTERPLRQQAHAARQQTSDAVDLGGLDGFLKRKGRKNAGETFSEHGLTGSGRTDHQHVMDGCW